jgi:hypothetical protein
MKTSNSLKYIVSSKSIPCLVDASRTRLLNSDYTTNSGKPELIKLFNLTGWKVSKQNNTAWMCIVTR